jgi:hypothetical protein
MAMTPASPEMVLVPDEELRRLADERGPTSAEAQALTQLTSQRAQDLQVHCFRVGDTYVTARCRMRQSRRMPIVTSSMP